MRRALLVGTIGAALVAVTGSPPLARACSVPAWTKYQIESGAQSSDRTPPTLAAMPAVVVRRGPAPEGSGCTGTAATSCDGTGSIGITPVVADDVTAPAAIGYRLKVIGGALPQGAAIPSMDVESLSGAIYLHWDDGEKDSEHEPFTFTLELVALDRAGNASPPVTVIISDDGDGGGCAISGGRGAAIWPLALLLALVVATRRLLRRRIPGP